MPGSMRHRGGDSWELRVYLGRHPETGKERWVTRTVHGSRRQAGHQLRALVEEAHAARIHAGTMAELFERWFAAAESQGDINAAGPPSVEPGSYIVQLNKNTTTPYDVAASAPFTIH